MRNCNYTGKNCFDADKPCDTCWVKMEYVDNKKSHPLLDELEKGPWPQFVSDMKKKSRK